MNMYRKPCGENALVAVVRPEQQVNVCALAYIFTPHHIRMLLV